MDLDELLTKAEESPAPSRTVRVCVNPEVAKQRAVLLAALDDARVQDSREEDADARLGAAPPADTRAKDAVAELEKFDEEAARALVEIRFTRLPGTDWAKLTSTFPMRIDVALDRTYGYNFDAVSEAAARSSGKLLTDDGETEITGDQWDRLFTVLAGHDVEQIRDAVWTLNEYEPQQHVAALVKSYGAA